MGFTLNIGQNPGRTESHALELRLSVDPIKTASSALTASQEDASTILASAPRAYSLVVANNAKSFLEVADSALSSIRDLRQKQLDLAEEAEDINDPDQSSRLQTEFNNISTEITRIATDATFNGQNVISGKTFTISDTPIDITQHGDSHISEDGTGTQAAIVLGNFTTVTGSLSLTLTNQTSAATAVDTLEIAVESANHAADAARSALNQATSVLESTLRDPATDFAEPRPKTEAEADKLVLDLVKEIKNNFSKRDPGTDSLFYNLDPSRVSDLLVEP